MIGENGKLAAGSRVRHPDLYEFYDSEISDEIVRGVFVEIRKDVTIGARVKIQTFVFLPEGVLAGDGAFGSVFM